MSSPSDPDELAVSGTRERGVTVTEVDAGDELANFMGGHKWVKMSSGLVSSFSDT